MVDAFRAVLNSPTAGFGLRSVVVDALAMGTSLPAMKDDLANVLTRRASPFAERLHALAALLRLGPDGKALVVQAYRERLGQDDSSIRLRSEIVAQLYGHGFGLADAAQLMGDTLTAEEEVTTGALRSAANGGGVRFEIPPPRFRALRFLFLIGGMSPSFQKPRRNCARHHRIADRTEIGPRIARGVQLCRDWTSDGG